MATVVELPKTPRQPDGVFLDPEPALPRAVAKAPARGIVSLKEPVGDGILRAAIETFFAAFTDHEPDALDGVLSHSARLLDSHGASSYTVVRDELLRRVAAFKASNVTKVQIDGVERYEYDDLEVDGTSAALPRRGQDLSGMRARPSEMRPGDILARVHLIVPRVGGDRLFGDVVVLLFRWDEDAEGSGSGRLRVVGFDEQDVR
jgi:hypothetical protein